MENTQTPATVSSGELASIKATLYGPIIIITRRKPQSRWLNYYLLGPDFSSLCQLGLGGRYGSIHHLLYTLIDSAIIITDLGAPVHMSYLQLILVAGPQLNYYAAAYTMHQHCTVPEYTVAGEIA